MTLIRPTHTRGSRGQFLSRYAQDWRLDGDTPVDRQVNLTLNVRQNEAEDGSGTFEGWACIYGVRDTYGTTFDAGCFTRGGLDESPYALLHMHSPLVPLATFTAEDRDQGLWISGTWDPTPDGQAGRARALSGSAPELSVGFVWLDDGGDDDPDLITSARLVETSQITLRMAAVPGAGFQGVRDTEQALEAAESARLQALLTLADLTAGSI
jgi:HK97 family phage prohead protease